MNIMIAGASGGIGRYLTEQFDRLGNTLYLTYHSRRDMLFQPFRAETVVSKCDFSAAHDVEATFSSVVELDVLINVMGRVENRLIQRMDEGEWDRVIASNFKTVFLSCKFGVSKMADGGHIINISSVLGDIGMPGATNYVVTKGGVEAFTRSFALECLLGTKKIFVNAIALGYFKIGEGLRLTENIAQMAKERIPLKEFGDPEEIYKAVSYLISSKYMVGQTLRVNGGLCF